MQITKTTTHLKLPSPRALWNLPPHIAGAIVTFAAIAIVAVVGRIQSTPAPAIAPTAPLPIVIIATSAPAIVAPTVAQPQLVAFQPAPAKMVVAFAAPSGDVLGPIPAPATSAILGRWGDSWIMVPWQGSNVWIRAADLGLNLANLAPQPPAPAVSAPIYQVSNDQQGPPEPTSEPAQPIVVAAPQSAPVAAPAQQDEPKIVPAFPVYTPSKDGPDPITFTNVQEEWKFSHCVIVSDPTTCH